MPRAKASSGTDAGADPDRLVRQHAGTYRTADDRFEVREADAGWFVVDAQLKNEFGQERIHGPYRTLKSAREAVPGHREASGTVERAPRTPRRRGPATKPTAPPPPPPSWIDELPRADAATVRRQIAALEAEGISDAEALVRRDRDGLLPAIATQRLEARLASLVTGGSPGARAAAEGIVRRVAEVLSAEGQPGRGPLPGWALVEVGPGDEPAHRRIDLSGQRHRHE